MLLIYLLAGCVYALYAQFGEGLAICREIDRRRAAGAEEAGLTG